MFQCARVQHMILPDCVVTIAVPPSQYDGLARGRDDAGKRLVCLLCDCIAG